MKLRKVQMLVAFGVLAAMGGGASLAWACSPQPNALVLSASSGGVGDTVEVTGSRFDGRVEVRWQSADGPVLGRSSASSFTMPVTIPPVPKGVYNIVAVVWNEDGTIYQKQVEPFNVAVSNVVDEGEPTPPPVEPVTPPEVIDPTVPPENSGDPATPPPAIEPETEPATPTEPAAPADEVPAAPAPRVDTDPAPAPATSPDVAPATTPRRSAAPAPAASLDSAPAPALVDAPAAADAAASVPTVTGDLWSGFDSGTSSLTGAESFGTDAPTTDNTGMKAGVALLVAGLIALCMAGAATAVSRRRAVAVNDSEPASDI